MSKLILTVGLPRSGKTTWAKTTGFPIVSPDAIRISIHGQAFIPQAEAIVWAMCRYMVSSLFIAGHETVILDACNTTNKRRDEWRDDRWELYFKVFLTGENTCKKRALRDERPELLPVIDRMMKQWEKVEDAERWNE